MDVLLSLPVLSYFATPLLTSWSTSLNILFFYITWATLVFSHSPLKIEVFGTLALRVIFWLIPSLFFLVLDVLAPSLVVEPMKIPRSAASAPRRTFALLARHFLLALLNLALLTALQAALSTTAATLLRRPPFKTSTALPLPWHMIRHVCTLYATREVLTYYVHRFVLHAHGVLGKLHAEYAHERKGAAPYSLMLYADHPLPLLLVRLVPSYLPALYVRPHLLTYFLFTIMTTVEEMVCMSGYNVGPGISIGGVVRRTAIHYVSGGMGNYSVWGILDYVHGTSVGEEILGTRGKAKGTRRVTGRVQKVVGKTGKLVKEKLVKEVAAGARKKSVRKSRTKDE